MAVIIGGPIILWGLALLPIAGLRKRRRLLLKLIVLANLIATWALGLNNYFWVVAFVAMLMGILIVIDQVNRHFDLVIPRFMREWLRWLLLASTIWWVAGIMLKFVG